MNRHSIKNALIVGGSSGIGLDVAKRLAAREIAVTVVGRDNTKLGQAGSELKLAGSPQVITKAVDLYSRTQVDAFVREISLDAPFEYLVNSAAAFARHLFLSTLGKTTINTMTSMRRSFSLRRRWPRRWSLNR